MFTIRIERVEVHLHSDPETTSKLDQILKLLTSQGAKMSQLQQKIDDLTAQVQKNTDVEKSALALIQGFGAQLAAAIQAANEAGATSAELDALTNLRNSIAAADDELAAAVAANTAPAPVDPPPAPDVP